MTRFAVQTQELICSLDQVHPGGWIVDLRGNSGGDMWPMVAGLGPIIGDGVLGAFVAPDGRKETGSTVQKEQKHRRAIGAGLYFSRKARLTWSLKGRTR
jgi:hypothetical protein